MGDGNIVQCKNNMWNSGKKEEEVGQVDGGEIDDHKWLEPDSGGDALEESQEGLEVNSEEVVGNTERSLSLPRDGRARLRVHSMSALHSNDNKLREKWILPY